MPGGLRLVELSCDRQMAPTRIMRPPSIAKNQPYETEISPDG
jgi:hypothetical protein